MLRMPGGQLSLVHPAQGARLGAELPDVRRPLQRFLARRESALGSRVRALGSSLPARLIVWNLLRGPSNRYCRWWRRGIMRLPAKGLPLWVIVALLRCIRGLLHNRRCRPSHVVISRCNDTLAMDCAVAPRNRHRAVLRLRDLLDMLLMTGRAHLLSIRPLLRRRPRPSGSSPLC